MHGIQAERKECRAHHTLFRFQHPEKIVGIAPDLLDTIRAHVNLNIRSNRLH